MAHKHNNSSTGKILITVGRGIWRVSATCIATFAWLLFGVWVWFENLAPWNWVMSAAYATIAIMTYWTFPMVTPIISDVRRFRARRSVNQERLSGNKVARDLALIPELDDDERTLKQLKRLPDARFVKREDSCVLDAPQLLPGTIQQITQRATAYAPTLKMLDDHVLVIRPSPDRVTIVWRSTQPIDQLASMRISTFEQFNGALVLGRIDNGVDFTLDLIGDAWGLAIQGQTRSGKSVFTYVLLAGYANMSRQGGVIIGGIDPTGLLLSVWKDHPGREFRAIGLANLDAITATLDAAIAEMERRIAWLVAEGRDKTTSTDFAPLIFTLEEFPGLIASISTADAALATKERRLPRVKSAVQRLIQEGAKVGVRVVLIAQRFDASIIGGSERSNLATRISCRVDNRDAVAMLHPDADTETVERIRGFAPGYAFVETPGEFPRFVRFDVIDYQEYRRRVTQEVGNNEQVQRATAFHDAPPQI